MEYPLFHNDPELVKSVFSTAYEIPLMEDYRKKHKVKPLKSVPQETLQTMRTEIFLTANYDMRKNLMTGVAEYRMKYSEDQTFKPLTEEVRNDMTIEAREQGLKSWDQDVCRHGTDTTISPTSPGVFQRNNLIGRSISSTGSWVWWPSGARAISS